MAVSTHLDDDGSRKFLYSGIIEQLSPALLSGTGVIAETLSRLNTTIGNVAPLTSGQLYLQACWLRKGDVITSITFFSGTQAAVAPLNQVFSIYNGSRALIGQTADDTSTAWAANTAKTLSFATPVTIQTTGLHYIGISVAVTTTVPSLSGATKLVQITNVVPILHGTSTGSLTATMPASAAAITGAASAVYATLQ